MPRETKEERLERETKAAAVREAAAAAYRATIPNRLMQMQALATEVGVSTNVRLTPTGLSVHFYNDSDTIGDTITYETEEWELEYLEQRIRKLKDEQDAANARRTMAQKIFDTLTVEQKNALKENIHFLR